MEEQYEEALFALLMDEFAVEEGKKALQKNEELKADPQAAVPETTQRRCLKTIRRRFSAKTSRVVGRVTVKVINKVAVVVLLGSLLFTAAFAASSEFRHGTLNFVIDVFDDRTVFHAETESLVMPQSIEAGWLPEGFKLVSYDHGKNDVEVLYKTKDGKEIEIIVSDANGNKAIDTEDTIVNTVMINNYEAVTIVKSGTDGYGVPYERSRVVWIDTLSGWCIDIVSYQENVETLVQIAENLILK